MNLSGKKMKEKHQHKNLFFIITAHPMHIFFDSQRNGEWLNCHGKDERRERGNLTEALGKV